MKACGAPRPRTCARRSRSGGSAGSPSSHENLGRLIDLRAVFAVNRKVVNTAIGRDVKKALKSFDLPVLDAAICQRVIFVDSAANGCLVAEMDERAAGAREVESVTREILEKAA